MAEDGEYSQITLTSGVTADDAVMPGNLFMFGELNSESVELVVLGIEPAENMTARLTLTDYSPAVYNSDTEVIPPFDSQITLPAALLQRAITQKPIVTGIISDESVMTRLAPGRYEYAIRVSFRNPADLPERVTHVEAQIDYQGDASDDWMRPATVPVAVGAITFIDVEEGESYKVRLRYIDEQGRAGKWEVAGPHTVIGKTTPAPYVDRFKVIEQPGGLKQFFWQMESPPPDLFAYEVWYSLGTIHRPWDQMIHLFAKDHRAQQHKDVEPAHDGVVTFAIVAIDDGGRRSAEPHYITEVLDGDQFCSVLKIVLPHEQDWPGEKTDCYVSGTSLMDSGVLTWRDLDIAWDETAATWANTAASPIIYEHRSST